MQIVIFRHGKSSIRLFKSMGGADFQQWLVAYDQAGICSKSLPSGAANLVVVACRYAVCSDLLRAFESARRLHPDLPLLSTALYREAEMPWGTHNWLKLPPAVWSVWYRFWWMLGYAPGVESFSAAQHRAQRCAEELVALAQQYGTVLLVGHGFMNCLIVKRLRASGWRGPWRLWRQNWAFSVYRSDGSASSGGSWVVRWKGVHREEVDPRSPVSSHPVRRDAAAPAGGRDASERARQG